MVKLTDRPAMTIAVDMGRKATKTNNTKLLLLLLLLLLLFDLIFFCLFKVRVVVKAP